MTPARIRADLDVLDGELSEEQVARVSALARGTRLGPDPETCDAA